MNEPMSDPMSDPIWQAAHELRAYALGLPGVREDFPWGERVVKVNNKVFVFLGRDDQLGEGLGFSVKLPESAAEVLALGYAKPTGYGLGKSGWVSVAWPPGEAPPVLQFKRWIAESFRAVAPKRVGRLVADPE